MWASGILNDRQPFRHIGVGQVRQFPVSRPVIRQVFLSMRRGVCTRFLSSKLQHFQHPELYFTILLQRKTNNLNLYTQFEDYFYFKKTIKSK